MIFMTRYIKLNNEHGRLPLQQLNGQTFKNVTKIELHLGSNITANEWLGLSDSLPDLVNVKILNNSGKKQTKTTIETIKICNIIKNMHNLKQEIKLQDNTLLSESLNKYRNAIAGVLGESQNHQCLVEIEEHLSMTLDILKASSTTTPKSPAELENYLSLTDQIFANRSNKQWYINAKHLSMTLVAGASLALFAGCLISSSTPILPLMAINYVVSGNVMPILASAIIGLFGINYTRSQAEKCTQQENLIAQSDKIGLFFSPAKQVKALVIDSKQLLTQVDVEPSAPPAYDDLVKNQEQNDSTYTCVF